MRDALVLVDVITTFDHDDGERMLESFRGRVAGMRAALEHARVRDIPCVYANDNGGRWDSDVRALVDAALAGPGGELVRSVAPAPGDLFVVKPRYSAFDHTPLELLLDELRTERLLLAGTATEGCVVQTAIDARERGLKVTILRDACATNDARLEAVALEYAEQVVGARIAEAASLRAEAR